MDPKRILYVDDEEDMRLVVSVCLESDGYRVLTAASVPDALLIAARELPDVVITDVMMPGENGYSLCTKLKRDPATRDIPVIVVTSLDSEREAMQAGASAFLSKPFEDEDLRAMVRSVLAREGRGPALPGPEPAANMALPGRES